MNFEITSLWTDGHKNSEVNVESMAKRKAYNEDDLDRAVNKYLAGMKLKDVCNAHLKVPERTITRSAKNRKEGIEAKQPRPKPILSTYVEDDFKSWIVSMQSQEFPVSRDVILVKANEMFSSMYRSTCHAGSLKLGWLKRFMERHPMLRLQSVKYARTEVSEEGITAALQQCKPDSSSFNKIVSI